MGDLKARIKAKLLRRQSHSPSVQSSKSSSKSWRPRSQRTNKNSASSEQNSHDADDYYEDSPHLGNESPRSPWSAHWHRSRRRHSGGHQPASPEQTADTVDARRPGKSRPSTVDSATLDVDEKLVAAAFPPAKTASSFSSPAPAEQRTTSESNEPGPMVVSTAELDGTNDNSLAAVAVDPSAAETLTSSEDATNKTACSSLPSGDQQTNDLTNVNSSSSSPPAPAPAAINTTNTTHPIIPSIVEQSATPTLDVSLSRALDSDHDGSVASASLSGPSTLLNTSSAETFPTSTTSILSAPARDLQHTALGTEIGEAVSGDFSVPTTPSIASAGLQPSAASSRPDVSRQQSILPIRQQALIKTLLDTSHAHEPEEADQLPPISPNMVTRKIWVKRPGASATMITINEDDLVDDVRDMILRKYANSLGRQFDSPDLTIRVVPKDEGVRQLQPDEPMGRTLDAYFPGGQTVNDALLIDVPPRRTPKASPIPRYYGEDNSRPHESGTDYFPPFPQAPHIHHSNPAAMPPATIHFPQSMAIVSNGQLPPLPSPGGTSRRLGSARPKMQRLHTASPVSTAGNSHVQHTQHAPVPIPPSIGTHAYSSRPQRSRTHSGASSDQTNHAAHAHAHPPPTAPPLPTPPVPERVATPPPRVASPRPAARPKKKRTAETPSLPPGMLNGSVPPINVLIVEDNIINLKLLEAFVKRLKVRWQTAMNGRDAVTKWRTGGFHLVLMDIQLPIMNGLDATREIRRIEKVNSIGVFSSSASKAPEGIQGEPDEKDKLPNTEMFKSPVIIVALTASSLQSDRHEALAAGCNDFLTKPVNFVWLERKVMEWGCMQALIDFDGWRKWKDFSQKSEQDDPAKKAKAKKTRQSLTAPTATAAA
ncbi:hypothetical protein PFICI_02821 [Pestalotiopsis fici W106-1]|uniref:Response regulatory domain-containing protein n=1 Tax=Pestalotiopsis fici (strain W106-1 / CGMCC3.15140) TaxID=1229662 RepID=W3XHV1_PESFW|nr:uncharacterized protein PFICI_02821 [Pestalotiopsis fici W106-1]ETS84796.1 hypothetical protein PFICI_02821 [Pestalotiopsis fici W106-1]